MGIKLKQFNLVSASALFCTIAFSSALSYAGQPVSSQTGANSLVATASSNDEYSPAHSKYKLFVCQVIKKGPKHHITYRYKTHNFYKKVALKRIAQNPNKWKLGRCEDVISPS